MQTTPRRPRKRIELRRALRAMRALLGDPDDTPKVFEIIDALSGNTGERLFRRFRRSPAGARVLHEQRALLATLDDRACLHALPPGSLGRLYAEFAEREQLSAGGLMDASAGIRRSDLDPERRLFADRLRDMHDLWHVVTGYGRDLLGEAALLAFSFAQTRNPGVGFIVGVVLLRTRGDAQVRRLILDAWRRGRRAAWLPAQDWEALLEQPLASVREQLAVGAPPNYGAVRSAGAPVLT